MAGRRSHALSKRESVEDTLQRRLTHIQQLEARRRQLEATRRIVVANNSYRAQFAKHLHFSAALAASAVKPAMKQLRGP